MPFKPGQSGNPNGRPKVGESLATYFRQHAKEPKVREVIVDRAADGEEFFVKLFMEYAYGKPKDSIELSGPEGTPLLDKFVDGPPQEGRLEWEARINKVLNVIEKTYAGSVDAPGRATS